MIYGELTSSEIAKAAKRAIAVLPVAAIEQHGAHLPVVTDTAVVEEIVRRVEKAMPREIVTLPTLWAGNSHHHRGFPGVLSLRSETYILVLKEMVECLLESGFRKILLLNGHGGNVTPLSETLYRITMGQPKAKPPWVVAASYWTLSMPEIRTQTFMETPKLTHACEYETSLMLSLREDWVKMGRAKGERSSRNSEYYDPLGYEVSRVMVSETFRQMTEVGAMGKPEKATAEKGSKLFDLVTASVVKFLREYRGWKMRP